MFQDEPTIGAIDDISAALSAIRESILILSIRREDDLIPEDEDELQRILDACDRIQEYHLAIRAIASAAYQDRLKASTR